MPEWDDSPSTGVIWDEPSPVQLLNSTKEGGMRRMFRQIAGQVAAEVSGPSKALASDVPLVNVSPGFLMGTSPVLRMLPKAISEGAAEAGAGVLSGMTAPSALRLGALVPIAPTAAAGIFAGLGAKGAGESLGQASVDVQERDTKNATQHTLEGLAALAQMLPLLGLRGGRSQADGGLVKLPGEEPGVVSPPKVENAPLQLTAPEVKSPEPVKPPEPVAPPASPVTETPPRMWYLQAEDLLGGKELGFNPEAKIEGGQLRNRLKNKLPPGEFQGLEEAGLGEFLKEKRSSREVGEWVKERGPRVEVRRLTADGGVSKEAQELAGVEHELDTKLPGWRQKPFGELESNPVTAELAKRQHSLFSFVSEAKRDTESATARYTMVNPKPLDKMPGAVDLLVRVPLKKEGVTNVRLGSPVAEEIGLKYSSSHYPTEGKNLLAHVRGYMETLPADHPTMPGKKVFHVFEVQSDWAQAFREQEATHGDPLLKHYERLALKAAIDHARKNGADAVALSDAETAMLTEGHDRVAARQEDLEGGTDQIPQEKGMRLHYDKTLPKIMEELTGEKGAEVGFGEHQNTLVDPDKSPVDFPNQPRSDLIFKNPDGTPKTSITARLYPLERTRRDLSLFGSDKAEAVKPKAPEPMPVVKSEAGPVVKGEAELASKGSEPPIIPPSDRPPLGLLGDGDSGIPKEVEALLPPKISETAKEYRNAFMRQTLPRTTAVNPDLAGKLIQYGNSRQEASALGESLASEVLGKHWKDTAFDRKLGDVLVEGMLRADGQTSIGKEWSSLKTEQDYVNALADKDIQWSIKKHKLTVQDAAEQAHTELGGSLAEKDPVTGAFVNMKAVFGDEASPETFGRSTRLTEPMQKGSAFSRKRKGTAEQYETSYRALAKRMIEGNYDEVTKQRFFDEADAKGLGRYLKQGEKAPKGSVIYDLKRKGVPKFEEGQITGARTYVKRFALREDLADEFERAADLVDVNRRSIAKKVFGKATDIQTTLGVDAAVHAVQVALRVNNAERASGLHAIGGIREVDSVAKLTHNIVKGIFNDPKTQKAIAQYSEVSPGPEGSYRKGLFGAMLKYVDRGARLTLNDFYNGLVKKGTITDSIGGREKFISSVGQYNRRLMSKLDSDARDYGVGPFVTAGRTMNANAVRSLLMKPSVEGADFKQDMKLRAQKVLGTATSIGVIVPIINYIKTGNVFGARGTPIGAIGWEDEKGQLKTIDVAKWLQLRRPITGLAAIDRDFRAGKKGTEIAMDAAYDSFKGMLHPYIGPGVNALSLAASGKDVLGYKEADRPDEPLSKLKAAALSLNPTVEAAMSKEDSVLEPYRRATGYKEPKLTAQDQAKRIAEGLFKTGDLNTLKPGERLQVSKESRGQRAPADLVEQRKRAEFALRQDFASRERVQSGLSKENQAFLEKHKLTLPEEYAKRSIEEKNKGLYSPKERTFLEERLTANYDRALARLSGQRDFDKLTQAQKQNRVKGILRGAYQVSLADVQQARKEGKFSGK